MLVHLDLHDHVVTLLAGGADAAPEALRELLENPEFPPWQPATPELAADFIRGALAANERSEGALPADMVQRYLAVVPESRHADPGRWLLEPGGPTPSRLLQTIREMPPPELVGQGKEHLLVTRMVFGTRDREHVLEVLRNGIPGVIPDLVPHKHPGFLWTRTHPTRRWSPVVLPDGRQVTGRLEVTSDRLRAEAISRGMAARLAQVLKRALGDAIELRMTHWEPYQLGMFTDWVP
ncbi:MAG: hypothetical protein AB2A00_17150 [Myxococcota bacterium]